LDTKGRVTLGVHHVQCITITHPSHPLY